MARFQKALAQLMKDGTRDEPRPSAVPTPRSSHSVIAALEARVIGDELDLVLPFAKIFLANAGPLETTFSATDIAGLTLSACRFLCDRLSSPYALRVVSPAESEGWQCDHWVLEVAADDQVALVESICEAIETQSVHIEVLISAHFKVERDTRGMARSIAGGSGDGDDERLLHIQIAGALNPSELEAAVRRCLDGIDRRQREGDSLAEPIHTLVDVLRSGAAEDAEIAELITWMESKRTHWVGYQEAAADGTSSAAGLFAGQEPAASAWKVPTGAGVTLRKTKISDPTHARSTIDELHLRPHARAAGQPLAYRLAARLHPQILRESTSGIPVARKVCGAVLDHLANGSAEPAAQTAIAILDSLPLDFVLAVAQSEIARLVRAIEAADGQPTFSAQPSPTLHGNTFLTVIAPRQHLARGEVERVVQIVAQHWEEVGAAHFVDDHLKVARLHCALASPAEHARPEVLEEIVAQVRNALSSWRHAPVVSTAEAEAAAPPEPIHLGAAAESAPANAAKLRVGAAADPNDPRRFTMTVPAQSEAGDINRLMRSLDNLGLLIVRHTTRKEGGNIHEIVVEGGDDGIDPARCAAALEAVRRGASRDDALASLIWRANLDLAAIAGLRALCALAEQRGSYPRSDLHRALVANPECAANLARAMAARFDRRFPASDDAHRRHEYRAARERYLERVDDVLMQHSHSQLAALAPLLDACVRTSLFLANRPGAIVAIKIDSTGGEQPASEILVAGTDFEGLLLRRGKVARAPLWLCPSPATLRSDVMDELRRQRINAGYVAADAGSAGIALFEARHYSDTKRVDAAMRAFVDAILTVADNVERGEVVHERDLIVYDGEDPYLSFIIGDRPTGLIELTRVAAKERGFWMAEASVSHDDRRVASEGAWATIRPALESRKDEQSLSAVAIGSPHQLHLPATVRLVAAFDEHEIFIDSHAKAKSTHEALAKLALQPTASWSAFPKEMRAPGAAVIERKAAKLDLSDEVATFLGLSGPRPSMADLIAAVLALPVDLLWCVGQPECVVIGSDEPAPGGRHLVVPAERIRARAIAEISDDLCTPGARVELDGSGCILHGPNLDTLAAALLADRVSNIEMALEIAGGKTDSPEIGTAELAAGARRTVIEAARNQSQAITLDRRRMQRNRAPFDVCAGAAPLPAAAHSISGALASRPYLAELRAMVGEHIQTEVRTSSLCEDPYVSAWVDDYFPELIAEHMPGVVEAHPLRHEIAALIVGEKILETMGAAFVAATAHTFDRQPIAVIKAWCAVYIFGGAGEVRDGIEGSSLVATGDNDVRHRLALDSALARAAGRLIDLHPNPPNLEKIVQRYATPVAELLRGWPEILPDEQRADYRTSVAAAADLGLSETAAENLARISDLDHIVDICDLAIRINRSRATVAKVYLELERVFHFAAIDAMIEGSDLDPKWGSRAAARLRTRLATARRNLSAQVLAQAKDGNAFAHFVESDSTPARRTQQLFEEAEATTAPSLAAVEVLIASLEAATMHSA